MSSLYHPYASLPELLEAAGVSVTEMDRYTTPELQQLALERKRQPGAPLKERGKGWATRSFRIPFELETAADRKARASGTNLNRVVTALLEGYVNGRS